MVLGSNRGQGKTRIGSRNVILGVGMWVIGYELSTRGIGRQYSCCQMKR